MGRSSLEKGCLLGGFKGEEGRHREILGHTKMKHGKGSGALVLFYFQQLYFIITAACFFLQGHAAFAAVLLFRVTYFHTGQITHTVVQVYNETRTNGKISQ